LHRLFIVRLNPKRQTSKSQRSPSTEISFGIGYWSFFGVWTFAIWDFQRTGCPVAVQKSAVADSPPGKKRIVALSLF
jgi:hypothetical protein